MSYCDLPDDIKNRLENFVKGYNESLTRFIRVPYISHVYCITPWKEQLSKDPELIWRMMETDAKDINDIYVE